jgi:hypothetical protein
MIPKRGCGPGHPTCSAPDKRTKNFIEVEMALPKITRRAKQGVACDAILLSRGRHQQINERSDKLEVPT